MPLNKISKETLRRPTGNHVVRLDDVQAFLRHAAKHGLRVVLAQDTYSAGGVDKGDAHAVVFERLKLAVISESMDPERFKGAMSDGKNQGLVASWRPEGRFTAHGLPLRSASQLGATLVDRRSRSYLLGYLDGVTRTVHTILDNEPTSLGHPGMAKASEVARSYASASWAEDRFTWSLQATGAANSLRTGKGIRIAVLDSGIDLEHPDFANKALGNKMCFVPDLTVRDDYGHGTHIAGTIAGARQTDGNRPGYGIAPDAHLYIGRVLDENGFGDEQDILHGIDWALSQGCDIINLSIGTGVDANGPVDADYERIGQLALESNCLIIASAGNDSRRPDWVAPVASPANCQSIMAVAAVDQQFNVGSFSCARQSNVPGGDVDIAAPGVDVFSSAPMPNQYFREDGTSQAAAHVSGVAALLAESQGTLRGHALWGALIRSRRSLPAPTTDVGAGLIQAPP